MQAKVFDADGKEIVDFQLPYSHVTPRVIYNESLNIAYQLKNTGNAYEYHAVPNLRVKIPELPVLYDAEGKKV